MTPPVPPVRPIDRALAWIASALFALFPALSLMAANRAELTADQFLRPAAALVALSALAMAVLAGLLRQDPRIAGLRVCVGLLLLFAFFDLERGPGSFLIVFTEMTRPGLVVLPLWIALMVALPWSLGRLRRGRGEAVRAAAVMGTALCLQPAWTLFQSPPRPESDLAAFLPNAAKRPTPPPLPTPSAPVTTPDIYFVVLDAYGREDVLRRYYGFDNGPFLSELTRRGFTVARHSQANYLQTVLALAAAFNLDFVQNLPRPPEMTDVATLSPLIEDSEVRRLLRRRGYRTFSIPTGMPLTAVESADRIFEAEVVGGPRGINELEELLVARTPLSLIPRRDTSDFDQHRRRIEFAFDSLAEAAKDPAPKLVFAHILVPHPPFVFDAQGRPVDPPGSAFTLTDASGLRKKLSEGAYRDAYVAQLRYVNRRVLEAVDGIRRNAVRPAIVVVLGDHGPRMRTDWYSGARTDSAEAFRNLTAVSLPDRQPGDARAIDTLSPVNTFRFLLGTRFGMKLPLLPNRSWYSGLTDAFAFEPVPDPGPILP